MRQFILIVLVLLLVVLFDLHYHNGTSTAILERFEDGSFIIAGIVAGCAPWGACRGR